MARTTAGRDDKGFSLARVPALVLGSLLLAFGLLQLLRNNIHPTDMFPDGNVKGSNRFGFEGNGWTGLITSVAGGLLLFGAAQHHLAKTMSLIVGLALGACSVIALVDGRDVLGLAAANGWTKLGWGAAAAFLLLNTLMPRKGGRKVDDDLDRERVVERPAPAPARPVATERVREEPVRTERVETEPVRAEPVRAEPVRGEPVRTERVREEPVRTERVDDGGHLDRGTRDDRLGEPGAGRNDGSVADERPRDDRRL